MAMGASRLAGFAGFLRPFAAIAPIGETAAVLTKGLHGRRCA
jgi:hypothetical protein